MPNRLSKELSPYLLQHANNPVDWFPWSEEALTRAKAENKPILLSIGYSACHWCHVMEHESFEDASTAALMNEHFVSIKVDREERPDLDHIYQLVVQLMGRSGGWPLTVFLTPEQKPFFGGTYFPPIEKYGMPSFKTLLTTISEAWKNEHDDIVNQSEQLTRAIEKTTAMNDHAEITEAALAKAVEDILHRGDDANGGFGLRPKFPNSMALDVLLADAHARNSDAPKRHVALTLDKMRAGGMYDQLGGGFHRYSTDEKWLVPHFEKMLYDNALLLRAYADGYRVFGNEKYKTTCEEIAAYVLSEMRDKNGAFFSTEDADSEGEEGKYFVWTEGEARALLMNDQVARDVAIAHFGITEAGNFEHSMTTVLSEARPLSDVAKALKLSPDEAKNALTRAKRILLDARKPRVRPFRDEKILTSWNALMMGALAHAGAALGDKTMLDAAELASGNAIGLFPDFQNAKHKEDIALFRLSKDGERKGAGFLDDYAYLADAFLDLYEAIGFPESAKFAKLIADVMLEKFYEESRGFFFTAKSDTANANDTLIVRGQDAYDSAIPSGMAVACRVMLRLGTLVDERYEKIGERELTRVAPAAFRAPLGLCHSLLSMMRLVRGSVDVVLVGKRDDARTRALAKSVHNAYIPHRTIAWLDPNDAKSREAAARISEGKNKLNEPCAYVCRGRTCSLPVTDPSELARLIAE